MAVNPQLYVPLNLRSADVRAGSLVLEAPFRDSISSEEGKIGSADCFQSGQFDRSQVVVTNIIAEGHPVSQILSQLFDIIIQAPEIFDEQKARIFERIAEADKRLIDGADEYLQLLDIASNTMRALYNMTQESTYV